MSLELIIELLSARIVRLTATPTTSHLTTSDTTSHTTPDPDSEENAPNNAAAITEDDRLIGLLAEHITMLEQRLHRSTPTVITPVGVPADNEHAPALAPVAMSA